MGAVVLGVDMGVHSPRVVNKIKKKLMKVPGTYYCPRVRLQFRSVACLSYTLLLIIDVFAGVVEVNVSLFTGHVGIVVTADPATDRKSVV